MAEVRNDLRHIQRFFNLLRLPTCIYGAASGIQERLAFLPQRAGCEAPSSLRGCDPPEAIIRYKSLLLQASEDFESPESGRFGISGSSGAASSASTTSDISTSFVAFAATVS